VTAEARSAETTPSRPPSLPRTTRLRTTLRAIWPGVAAALVVAIVADRVAAVLPVGIAAVSIAVLLGLLVGPPALARLPLLRPGLAFAMTWILRTGIVLLGARLSLGEIASIGLPAAGIIVATMAGTLTLVLLASRAAAIERTLAVLLAVGAAVCGNSAVIATAPVIGAPARHVAFAVAVVTLFGTAAVFIYPAIAASLDLDDAAYGLWTGIAINDTSQVVAASAAMSPAALEVATVVKLIRNALMAPLLLGIAWAWARSAPATDSLGGIEDDRATVRPDTRTGLRRAVPGFVLAFLAMATLRSVGVISADLAAVLSVVAGWAILIGLAGVGLTTRFGELRAVGPRPLLVGFGVAVVVGAVTLAVILGSGIATTLPV
jgi:uncharacterized integral membrane protein (TIGR00698 family)